MKVGITCCVLLNLCLSVYCQSKPVTYVIGDALKWFLNLVWKKIQDYLPGDRRVVSPLDEMEVVHGFAKTIEKMLSPRLRESTKHICVNLYKKVRNKLERIRQNDYEMMVFFKMKLKDVHRFNELRHDAHRILDKINDHFHCEEERRRENEENKDNFMKPPFFRM